MTMTWLRLRKIATARRWLAVAWLWPLGVAATPQHATPPVPAPPPLRVAPVPPRPDPLFQQQVQQQQLRKAIQHSQLQSQLQQSVSNLARQPYADNPAATRQLDQADRARQDQARAHEQSLVDRYWGLPVPPPSSTRSR